MANKKKIFCADTSKMSDTEKRIMAISMKAGQEQINILRENQTEEKPNEEAEEEE